MSAEDLHAVVRLELDGRPLPVPALRKTAADYWGPAYTLDLAKLRGRTGVLEVHVRAGLRSLAGPLRGLGVEAPLRAQLRGGFEVLQVSCRGVKGVDDQQVFPVAGAGIDAYCVPGFGAVLHFTEALDAVSQQRIAAELAPFLEPSIKSPEWGVAHWPFTADARIYQAPTYALRLDGLPPRADIRLDLGSDVRSAAGIALPPIALRIRTGEMPAQLRAPHTRSVLVSANASTSGPVAINAGSVRLQLDRLGRDDQRETLDLELPRVGSDVTQLASDSAASTLREGGWVRWQAQLADGRDAETGPVEFAAPGFDLLALSGRREVLVWASTWDQDAAVAGATVELLWREQPQASLQVAAAAQTGADGVTVLRLPDGLTAAPADPEDYDWTGPEWSLRAAHKSGEGASERAVLSLGHSDYSLKLGRAETLRVWGVSDRPLYRAGETVRFSLWIRDLVRGELRAPAQPTPVALKLQDDERERTISQWRAVSQAGGLVTGDLELPQQLGDGTYCIGMSDERGSGVDGTCFHVGSHQAQDLWAEVESPKAVLRDGDRFTTAMRAGYFSGGPAAGLEVDELSVSLNGLPLSEAYPEFSDYTFVDVLADDISEPDLSAPDVEFRLDGDGGQRVEWTVEFSGKEAEARPAFGLLGVEATVSPSDRDPTSAYAETTRYARHERYVGLRTHPEWFDSDDAVQLEGVVITADGRRLADAEIAVTVEYQSGWNSDDKPQAIGQCTLRANTLAPCTFLRERPGRYRLVARSADAAPATLMRYVGSGGDDPDDAFEPALAVSHDGRGDAELHLRLQLTQPFTRARSLTVISVGGEVLAHQVDAIDRPVQELVMPMPAGARGWLNVNTYVRSAEPSPSVGADRHPRAAIEVSTLLESDLEQLRKAAPLALAFDAPRAEPGAQARIAVTNRSDRPRNIALSVLDDALRAQAQRWLPYADPLGVMWLGQRAFGPFESPNHVDFESWEDDDPWRWLTGAPLPVVVDKIQVEPALVPQQDQSDADLERMDTVEVTGSRIRRSDVVEAFEQKAPPTGARPSERGQGSAQLDPHGDIRLRQRFMDTALWVPLLRLAPGETRHFDFELPDNLTQWRAIAWSSDDAGEFAMQEAEKAIGLPVETRLQVPVRLFPGDQSRLAANVRQQGDAAAIAQVEFHVDGDVRASSIALTARGEASHAREVAPAAEGSLHVVATARTSAGADGVAAEIAVASPWIQGRLLQAGWLSATTVKLALPSLPGSARDPQLGVTLQRGSSALVDAWTRDLRDYPHRCWEQILSRAVAAALALRRHDAGWPDAAAVIDEALANASTFQTRRGGFVYFVEQAGDYSGGGAPLTAYTVHALGALSDLGHAVPPGMLEAAQRFLREGAAWQADSRRTRITAEDAQRLGEAAIAASMSADSERTLRDALWEHWRQLSLPAQVATAQALTHAGDPRAVAAVRSLVEQAPLRGGARRLSLTRRFDEWMSSDLREQCALIELVEANASAFPAATRTQLLAGISDLYQGGAPAVDTQSGAICLLALHAGDSDSASDGPAAASFELGAKRQRVELGSGESVSHWETSAARADTLRIRSETPTVPLSYVAELGYVEDARTAGAQAVGFALERRYAVLREGSWRPIADESLQEGDWLRITLELTNAAPRAFVALTDQVPGGLRPTDLELSAVAANSLQDIADEGSAAFATRRLDARQPRFYVESLPPGQHQVHYFARIANAGDYLAAPAVAELMYGRATRARTASGRLRFGAPAQPAPHTTEPSPVR